MHVHGELVDRPKWMQRIAKKEEGLKKVIAEELDPVFIPICGRKTEIITDERIAESEAKWKALNVVTDEELKIKGAIRATKDPALQLQLEADRLALETARKAQKEILKMNARC
jgi:hypothetical protein